MHTHRGKLPALDHRVDGRAAHTEPLGHLADREQPLREDQARRARCAGLQVVSPRP